LITDAIQGVFDKQHAKEKITHSNKNSIKALEEAQKTLKSDVISLMKLFQQTKELNKKIKDTDSVFEENKSFVKWRLDSGEERLDAIED
jgi:hypothetical protein